MGGHLTILSAFAVGSHITDFAIITDDAASLILSAYADGKPIRFVFTIDAGDSSRVTAWSVLDGEENVLASADNIISLTGLRYALSAGDDVAILSTIRDGISGITLGVDVDADLTTLAPGQSLTGNELGTSFNVQHTGAQISAGKGDDHIDLLIAADDIAIDGGVGVDEISIGVTGQVYVVGGTEIRVSGDGDTRTVSVSNVESFRGTTGSDFFWGAGLGHIYEGGAGSDYFHFVTTGPDIADYSREHERGGTMGIVVNAGETIDDVSAPPAHFTAAMTERLVDILGEQDFVIHGLTRDTFGSNDTVDRGYLIRGSVFADLFIGGDADDDFSGMDGDDHFVGSGGHDIIEGGVGIDTLHLRHDIGDYEVTYAAGRLTITDLTWDRDGTHVVSGVEIISFAGIDVSATSLMFTTLVANDDTNDTDRVIEAGTTAGDAVAAGNVLANDAVPYGQSASVTRMHAGSTGTLAAVTGSLTVTGIYGALTIRDDGAWSYLLDESDPDTNALAAGQMAADVFTYELGSTTGETARATLTISIEGANDAPLIATGASSLAVREGSVAVMNLAAWDAESTPSLWLSGRDAALFQIDASGQLRFKAAPDFETPRSLAKSNAYLVEINAGDGLAEVSSLLSISVTNLAGNKVAGNKSNNVLDATHRISGGRYATAEEDVIDGKAGKDTIDGGAGNDTIIGGLGNDRLKGGSGADRFVFNSKLGKTNIDTIVDFKPNTDIIALDDKIFKKIGSSLSASEFYAKSGATKAHDKSDRIIYDTKSGRLYYDADGSKSGAAPIHFATLPKKLALDHHDFLVV